MVDIIGRVFSGMFIAIFVIMILLYGWTSIAPTASAITIWGINFQWVALLIVLIAVLGSGYLVTKHFTSGFK